MTGVLKFKVDGQWVELVAGGVSTDEVWVGPTDPYLDDPNGTWEMWVRPAVPGIKSLCPAEPWRAYTSASVSKATLTFKNLKPGVTYYGQESSPTSWVTVTTPIQVANASGEATWETTVGMNFTFNVYESSNTTGPVVAQYVVAGTIPNVAIQVSTNLHVGVAYSWIISNYLPNVTIDPADVVFGGTLAGTFTPASLVTDATGRVQFTFTPTAMGTGNVFVYFPDSAQKPGCPADMFYAKSSSVNVAYPSADPVPGDTGPVTEPIVTAQDGVEDPSVST